MKSIIFWDMTPCSLNIYFRNFPCIHSFPQPKDITVTSGLLAFIYVFFWWVGSRPTAPTPNLGDRDFLSGLSPLAFGVPTPLLQGNKICNPRQGPLQVAISLSQPNPGFFRGCYFSPSSFLNRAWDRLWRRSEDGGDIFLRNVGCNSTDYTASYPRRWYCSQFKTRSRIDLYTFLKSQYSKNNFYPHVFLSLSKHFTSSLSLFSILGIPSEHSSSQSVLSEEQTSFCQVSIWRCSLIIPEIRIQ
jgi:hypothetical protein